MRWSASVTSNHVRGDGLYPGFASKWIDTATGRIFARTGGEGPPLLLLQGYPQTNML